MCSGGGIINETIKTTMNSSLVINDKKVKLTLQQAVKAHRGVRCLGSHIF
jgi:hypothetical protein